MHSDSTPFDGDALGTAADYVNDMFEQEELTNIGKEDPDKEDQDDEEAQTAAAAMEYDWEPIHPDQQELYEENDEQDDIPAVGIPHEQIEYNICLPNFQTWAILHRTRCFDEVYLNNIGCDSNSWALFTSKLDWEVAKWAKCRGPSSTAFSELLSIDGLQEALNLSYKNTAELNKIIDMKLPEVIVDGHSFELYSRDIVECICTLWGDSEFTPHLIFEPEQHYVDKDRTIRQYHDMHTAKWWWSIQRKIEAETKRKDCTIIPVLISSDKTQLTMFRNKMAYPHIRQKSSRHGQILLGYLPTTKLDHFSNKSSKCRTLSNLFHACMDFIMRPLQAAGQDGIVLVSTYIGDYPEQVMVTIIKTGLCPSCPAPREGIGKSPMYLPPQNDVPIQAALRTVPQGPTAFWSASEVAGIKPVPYPFWKHLPFVNIYCSIAPDILHQLFQGIIKHVISWVHSAIGDKEIDARCRRFPPNHHIRLFMKGICLIIGAQFPGHPTLSNHRLVCAVCSILDFVQLARYPTFHNNKSIFIDLGIRQHFNIIKLHYAQHYRFFIELFEWVFDHSKYIMCRQLLGLPVLQAYRPPRIPPLVQPRILRMTKYPSCRGVPFSVLRDQYSALDFEAALARMVVQHQQPELNTQQILHASRSLPMLSHQDPYAADATAQTVVDSLHAQPSRIGKYDVVIPGHFDTALVDFDDKGAIGVEGHAVARIRCLFTLPAHVAHEWFKGSPPSQHFAYVDWYTPFSAAEIDPPMSSVIVVDLIKASVHLFPSFGHKAPESWISSMVLDECKTFYVNPFNNRSQYSTII
ncbi:hypothetical protein BDQ17DRAFT_1394870 [Cyathus striatus]|nr:hypothetical protein BDQ17DRAFT_1394870 [Cyathus striatus]